MRASRAADRARVEPHASYADEEMAGLDEANLRVSHRVEVATGAGDASYTIRLVRSGAYDGPVYSSNQTLRFLTSRFWLILRRARGWSVVVERGSSEWRRRCPDLESAVKLGAEISAAIRTEHKFVPPAPR